MATYRSVWLSIMVVLAAAKSPYLANAGEPLHVGVAETDITPPQGFLIAGYYHERRATGTLDPLKAKAIVFRAGKELAALVLCDLTGIAVDLSTEVRRRASAKTGIPAVTFHPAAIGAMAAYDNVTAEVVNLRAKDDPVYNV